MSVPPMRELASPSEETVMSIREPRPAKGGRSAVTITAATLRVRSAPPRNIEQPMRAVAQKQEAREKESRERSEGGSLARNRHVALLDRLPQPLFCRLFGLAVALRLRHG